MAPEELKFIRDSVCSKDESTGKIFVCCPRRSNDTTTLFSQASPTSTDNSRSKGFPREMNQSSISLLILQLMVVAMMHEMVLGLAFNSKCARTCIVCTRIKCPRTPANFSQRVNVDFTIINRTFVAPTRPK